MALFVCALAMSVLGACVTTTVTRVDQTVHPPSAPEDVALFDRESDLPDGATVIAVIYLPGPASVSELATQVDGLRNEAAKLGAHAIVVREFTDPVTGASMENGLMGSATDPRGRVLAVRFGG